MRKQSGQLKIDSSLKDKFKSLGKTIKEPHCGLKENNGKHEMIPKATALRSLSRHQIGVSSHFN